MELTDDNKMVITDEDGNEHVVTILFTYHHDERNKDYVVFYEDEDSDEVMAMIYTEDGELIPIEDEEEYEELEEVLNAYQDGELEEPSEEDEEN